MYGEKYYLIENVKRFKYNDCDVYPADHHMITASIELDAIYNLAVGAWGYFKFRRSGQIINIKVKRVE